MKAGLAAALPSHEGCGQAGPVRVAAGRPCGPPGPDPSAQRAGGRPLDAGRRGGRGRALELGAPRRLGRLDGLGPLGGGQKLARDARELGGGKPAVHAGRELAGGGGRRVEGRVEGRQLAAGEGRIALGAALGVFLAPLVDVHAVGLEPVGGQAAGRIRERPPGIEREALVADLAAHPRRLVVGEALEGEAHRGRLAADHRVGRVDHGAGLGRERRVGRVLDGGVRRQAGEAGLAGGLGHPDAGRPAREVEGRLGVRAERPRRRGRAALLRAGGGAGLVHLGARGVEHGPLPAHGGRGEVPGGAAGLAGAAQPLENEQGVRARPFYGH